VLEFAKLALKLHGGCLGHSLLTKLRIICILRIIRRKSRIVGALTELHCGTMRIRSTLDKGTTVVLRFGAVQASSAGYFSLHFL
jgi:hypothetical protein